MPTDDWHEHADAMIEAFLDAFEHLDRAGDALAAEGDRGKVELVTYLLTRGAARCKEREIDPGKLQAAFDGFLRGRASALLPAKGGSA